MRDFGTVVITGPTGAIGVALCKVLLEKGIQVFAVCRPDSSRAENLPDGVKRVDCDLSRLDLLVKKIDSTVDVFFHFGWANTVGEGRNNMYSQNDNVKYSLDAVHAAKALGCKMFIGSGSQAEYGKTDETLKPSTACFPENGYGIAKLCAGQMCRIECKKLNMDFVWTRILSVYGPYDGENSMISSVIKKLLNGEKPALTLCNQLWDYIFSEDVAEAFFQLAQKGVNGKTYVIANGQSRPLKEYVEILRNFINPDLPLGFGDIACSNPISLSADISDLKKDTGFVPLTDFNVGILKTISYIRE